MWREDPLGQFMLFLRQTWCINVSGPPHGPQRESLQVPSPKPKMVLIGGSIQAPSRHSCLLCPSVARACRFHLLMWPKAEWGRPGAYGRRPVGTCLILSACGFTRQVANLDPNINYDYFWKIGSEERCCPAIFTSYGSLGENLMRTVTAWPLGWLQLMSSLMSACQIGNEEHSGCHLASDRSGWPNIETKSLQFISCSHRAYLSATSVSYHLYSHTSAILNPGNCSLVSVQAILKKFLPSIEFYLFGLYPTLTHKRAQGGFQQLKQHTIIKTYK